MTTKDTNPKEAIGGNKLPMHLWPVIATVYGCIGLLNGALKYGRSNWRKSGAKASTYYDATRRHFDRWWEGEEVDPDDGVPHLAAAMANLAILIDAKHSGCLTDDRAYKGALDCLNAIEHLSEHVQRLKELHKDKHPQHYTIQESEK